MTTTWMGIRRRDATGRWPIAHTLPGDKPAREPVRKRHKAKAGGLARRSSRNTKRGASGGQARNMRGRKYVIERRSHGEAR